MKNRHDIRREELQKSLMESWLTRGVPGLIEEIAIRLENVESDLAHEVELLEERL